MRIVIEVQGGVVQQVIVDREDDPPNSTPVDVLIHDEDVTGQGDPPYGRTVVIRNRQQGARHWAAYKRQELNRETEEA